MADTPREEFADVFWARHSNPWSGWSRLLLTPGLLYAVYRRNWRFLALVVAFAVVNPVLFPPPDDRDAWMTRVVLAERWWTETGHGTLGSSYPNVCNSLNLPVFAYALLAAWRRQPARAALAGTLSTALKLWFVAALVRRHERQTAVP
ncbi:MAG: DUF6653 family protein [Haloarculaceae archaeon]